MKFTVKKGDLTTVPCDALVVGVHAKSKSLPKQISALDRKLGGAITGALAFDDFSGDASQIVWLDKGRTKAKRVLVVGLGPEKDLTMATLRSAAGTALKAAQKAGLRKVALAMADSDDVEARASAVAEGGGLAMYDPAMHKSNSRSRPVTQVTIVTDAEPATVRSGLARGQALAAGTNLARDLVNEPANMLTPTDMAAVAKQMATDHATLKCKVWGPREIEKNKMGGIIGVGRGSAEPSQFIQLEYKPKGKVSSLRKIAFVGKGLTFDTGGISIKPAAGMELMKFDMGGAAAVLGAFKILALLEPKVHVLGYIASAENMPDGKAIKPGDLLTMMSGLTVEVNNTDAEGRLVLADALHYAKQQKPEFIVDAATLTGACMIALGDVACGLMSEDDKLVALIEDASRACDEPVWRLPLQDKHRKKMEGHVADLKNTGPREGGALTAAGFLSRFAEGARWAHLDIAGTVWNEEPEAIAPKGATGYGARLFAAIAEQVANGHR